MVFGTGHTMVFYLRNLQAARLAVGRGVHGGPLDAEISRLSTVTVSELAGPHSQLIVLDESK